MHATKRNINIGTLGTSIVDTVGNLQREFAHLQESLRAARSEVCSLRRQLATCSMPSSSFSPAALRSLRRHVAFYCHPDRGGNGDVMSQLNMLFDVLETSRKLMDSEASAEAAPC